MPPERISADAFRALHGAPPVAQTVERFRGVVHERLAADAARVRGGRAAKSAGDAHEDALDALHDVYRAAGRADIKRRPHLTRVIGQGPAKKIIHAGKNGADYSGVVRGGRALTVEAKTIADAGVRAATLTGMRDWPAAELADLLSCATLGGLACVVVGVRGGAWAGTYVLPVCGRVAQWEAVQRGETRIVPLAGDAALGWGIRRVPSGDYLEVLLSGAGGRA